MNLRNQGEIHTYMKRLQRKWWRLGTREMSSINICFKNRHGLLKIGTGNTQKPLEAQGQTTPAMPVWTGSWIYSPLPSSGANKSGAVAPSSKQGISFKRLKHYSLNRLHESKNVKCKKQNLNTGTPWKEIFPDLKLTKMNVHVNIYFVERLVSIILKILRKE